MSQAQQEIVIRPGRSAVQYWGDLWRYRELFYFLAWRDLLVRYKQTVIGLAWALLRPLLTMIVFTLVFGKLAKLDTGGPPYAILVFAALLPWQLFASSLSECGNSLIANSNLLTKVYFPRLIVPTSTVVVSLADFVVSVSILFGLMAWYDFWPTWRWIALPPLVMLALAASLGAGLWLAALNVKYRDFRYVVPFLVQFGLYISPVGFDSAIVPQQYRLAYSANPMVGVIDGFRWAILGESATFYWPGFLLSVGIVSVVFVTGIWFFRRTERTFADVI